MVDPIGAVGPAASLPSSAGAGQAGALAVPSVQQVQGFAAAAAAQPVAEVVAAPQAPHLALGERLMAQLDSLSQHLQSPPAVSASAQEGPSAAQERPQATDFAQQMEASIAQMDRAYMYAIEATMASHGSTETTKIFNTLLKGQ